MSKQDKTPPEFVKIPVKVIRHSCLPPDSRMLLVYLLSFGNSSNIDRESISEDMGVGRDKLQRMVKDLTECGYIKRETLKSSPGKIAGSRTNFTFKDE